MADQVVLARSGFYNSIDNDRLYYAEDMNQPYIRLVSDGVYPNVDGTESDDLKVVAPGGLYVTVAPGQGIFASKWFDHVTMDQFEVPFNGDENSRIDSVIVQIDERMQGRCANLVYRTGTPAASPVPPPINTETGVKEYRVANIRVRSAVSAVAQADITDLRGTSDCPWVTALITAIYPLSSADIDFIISKVE